VGVLILAAKPKSGVAKLRILGTISPQILKLIFGYLNAPEGRFI
jgi:hypothetical protein